MPEEGGSSIGGGGIGGGGEAEACNFAASIDGFEAFDRSVKKPVLPLGDAEDGCADFEGVVDSRIETGIGIGWLLSGGGIVTVRDGGVLGAIAGTCTGDAGVFGATSLASESPSWMRPGGSKGVCDGDGSDTDPWGGVSSALRPSASISRSTAW